MGKTALQKTTNIVGPVVSVDEAVRVFAEFQRLKTEVLQKDVDVILVKDRPYICKSGWQKLSTLFNLSFSIEDRTFINQKEFKVIVFKGRATSSNERFTEAEGWCSSDEPWSAGKTLSAMVGMAQTRCFNRAISLMVAPGETSYEEMTDVEHQEKRKEDSPNFSTFMRSVAGFGFDIKTIKDTCVKKLGKEIHKCSRQDLVVLYEHFNTLAQERQMERGGF